MEVCQVDSVRDHFDVTLHPIALNYFFHTFRRRYNQIHFITEVRHVCLKQAVTDLFGDERHSCLSNDVITGVVGENNRNLSRVAVAQGESSAEERVMDVDYVHGLEQFFCGGFISQ